LAPATRRQFFQIKNAGRNVSHIDELPGKAGIDEILLDMKDFFGT
jgi:hypothetical protein